MSRRNRIEKKGQIEKNVTVMESVRQRDLLNVLRVKAIM